MKVFLDSASFFEIKELVDIELIDGVTTNPSLIKKNKSKDLEKSIKEILKVCLGKDVSLEVVGTSYESMIFEAKILYEKFNSIADNVVIKIPVCSCDSQNCSVVFDSYKTIKELSSLGIPVNATLVFTPEQAVMAARAGAKYVSPFMGRSDDYLKRNKNGFSGEELILGIKKAFVNYSIKTQILAASIRNIEHFRSALFSGVDAITIPYELVKELFIHKKTIEGVKKFKEDTIEEYAGIVNEK